MLLAALALAACSNATGDRDELDGRVDRALSELYSTVPKALWSLAAQKLTIIPLHPPQSAFKLVASATVTRSSL